MCIDIFPIPQNGEILLDIIIRHCVWIIKYLLRKLRRVQAFFKKKKEEELIRLSWLSCAHHLHVFKVLSTIPFLLLLPWHSLFSSEQWPWLKNQSWIYQNEKSFLDRNFFQFLLKQLKRKQTGRNFNASSQAKS